MTSEEENFVGLAHIGIFTSNYEETVKFYTENLPFKIMKEIVEEAPEVDDRPNFPLKLAMLRLGNLYLEIMERADKLPNNAKLNMVDHIGIEVKDHRAAVQYLRSRGLPEDRLPQSKENITLIPGKCFVSGAVIGPCGERVGLYQMNTETFYS